MTPNNKSRHQYKIETIRNAIQESGNQWRARHPILARNNLIGGSILLLCITGIGLSALAYLNGLISAFSCIVIVAILTSLLHELEHDLIHWQYFKNNKPIHHLMMFCVWVFRPGTINPWIRRHLHFLHHKTSGTERDIEERGIGNGQPYTLSRWWIMFDPLMGNFIHILKGREPRKMYRVLRLFAAYFPFGIISVFAWYLFLIFHTSNGVASLLDTQVLWSETVQSIMSYINPLVIILIAPHYLRSFCLIFISSNMHYYGNVESVLQQTQVLNAWYFWPLQLFCFNFGSTHGIHHFVVGEPFYIRQLTAKDAHRVMKENGVPFNDLGTFQRRNRYLQAYNTDLAKEQSL